jgi:uncharacterized membrane protein
MTLQTNSTSSKNLSYHRCLRWALSAAAVALTSAASAFAEPPYVVTELPIPAGYDLTIPYQINDQGFVVGASSRPNDGLVATVWKNGTVQLLGRLKDGIDSIATAINSRGVVAGEGDDGDYRPLGWVISGGKLVNFFSNNGGNMHPVSINDAGEIGGYYVKGFSSNWRGAIWKVDAKDARKSIKIDLPLLPGSDPLNASATPWGFNKFHEAAGWCSNSAIGQHAVLWKNDAAHSIVDLGVFGADRSSTANDLNDYAEVVGSSHPPFGSRPVLWKNDDAHTAVELPLLPGDNYGSAAFINNSATMIGFSAASEPGTWNVGPSRIVIWIAGVVYDLESLAQPSGSETWTINEVRDINNPGQIAALATRHGVMRAVILTPAP